MVEGVCYSTDADCFSDNSIPGRGRGRGGALGRQRREEERNRNLSTFGETGLGGGHNGFGYGGGFSGGYVNLFGISLGFVLMAIASSPGAGGFQGGSGGRGRRRWGGGRGGGGGGARVCVSSRDA